jgi:hypothetical protein
MRHMINATDYHPAAPITAEEVRALREALKAAESNYCFINGGSSYVRATCWLARHSADDGTTPPTFMSASVEVIVEYVQPRKIVRHEVALGAHPRISNHGGDRRAANRYVATQTHYRSSAISAMRSLANIVREGDELSVEFHISNNTETLRSAHLDADSCDIIVARKGKVFAVVHVDHNVFPEGSAVSMSDYRSPVLDAGPAAELTAATA